MGGRIGQLLSRKLQALGAQVTVSARRSRDLGMIRAMGFRAAVTGQWEDLSPYRVIFNTVPAPVLSQRDLESTGRTACFWSWPPPPAELRPVAPQLDPGLRPSGKDRSRNRRAAHWRNHFTFGQMPGKEFPCWIKPLDLPLRLLLYLCQGHGCPEKPDEYLCKKSSPFFPRLVGNRLSLWDG